MKRTIRIVMIVILLGLAVVMFLRGWSGEDDRICQDGVWIQHGNPSLSMPSEPCGMNE